jgi:type II secretory pathway component PulJ
MKNLNQIICKKIVSLRPSKDGLSLTGFTLIEAMLALFITAIIVTMLSIVFNTGLRAFRQGRDILDITKRAQLVMTKMTSELSGAMVLPNVILDGKENEIFFMAPLENSSNYELCEVGYLLNGTVLQRHFVTKGPPENPTASFEYDPKTSQAPNYATGNRNDLCPGVMNSNNIVGLQFHYYNGTGWVTSWNTAGQLPQLVEIKLILQSKNNPAKTEEFVTRVYLPNSSSNP